MLGHSTAGAWSAPSPTALSVGFRNVGEVAHDVPAVLRIDLGASVGESQPARERPQRPPLGGGWHGKAVTGGESVSGLRYGGLRFSLPQSASLTAPSSEGALLGRLRRHSFAPNVRGNVLDI